MFLIDNKISVDKPLNLRRVSEYDNVLLQLTSARLITNYDSLVITILDNCYYNLRLILQFTTEQTFRLQLTTLR